MSGKKSPNRLAGIIATKGAAARPMEQPTRVAAQAVSSMPADEAVTQPVEPEPEAGASSKTPATAPRLVAPERSFKSLTLRLGETEYERLREFAFRHRSTHQNVIAAALADYLDKNEAS